MYMSIKNTYINIEGRVYIYIYTTALVILFVTYPIHPSKARTILYILHTLHSLNFTNRLVIIKNNNNNLAKNKFYYNLERK